MSRHSALPGLCPFLTPKRTWRQIRRVIKNYTTIQIKVGDEISQQQCSAKIHRSEERSGEITDEHSLETRHHLYGAISASLGHFCHDRHRQSPGDAQEFRGQEVRGNADQMRTLMDCWDSTSPRERTCRYTRKPNWTRWRVSSTNDHARHWNLKRRQKDLMHVLHRPVEAATQSRH